MRLDEGSHFDLSRDGVASEALQDYLNRAIRLLKRPTRAGWNQRKILSTARQAVTARFEGELTSLRFFRRQIAGKVKRYVKKANATAEAMDNTPGRSMTANFHAQNVTVRGDLHVTAARSINRSFNSPAAEGLSASLKTLTEVVGKLAARLPTQQAEQVGRDLDALKSEANSAHPRKPFYELTIKGITEAAKAVADLTSPIAEAVADVLSTIEGGCR